MNKMADKYNSYNLETGEIEYNVELPFCSDVLEVHAIALQDIPEDGYGWFQIRNCTAIASPPVQ